MFVSTCNEQTLTIRRFSIITKTPEPQTSMPSPMLLSGAAGPSTASGAMGGGATPAAAAIVTEEQLLAALAAAPEGQDGSTTIAQLLQMQQVREATEKQLQPTLHLTSSSASQ